MTKIICELGINRFGSKKIFEKFISGSPNVAAWEVEFQYRNFKVRTERKDLLIKPVLKKGALCLH